MAYAQNGQSLRDERTAQQRAGPPSAIDRLRARPAGRRSQVLGWKRCAAQEMMGDGHSIEIGAVEGNLVDPSLEKTPEGRCGSRLIGPAGADTERSASVLQQINRQASRRPENITRGAIDGIDVALQLLIDGT